MQHFKSSLMALALVASASASLATPVVINPALPSSVTITFNNPIFTGSGHDYDGVNITYAAAALNARPVAAGRFEGKATNLNNIDPSVFVDSVNSVFMYCYDIFEGIRAGQPVNYAVNFNGAMPRTLDFLGAVNWAMSADKSNVDPYAWLHPVNGNQGAAIQLGIWESLYDTGLWNLNEGLFQAANLNLASPGKLATAAYFKSFIDVIGTAPSLESKYTMTLEFAGAQDMIAGDPPSDVPEPGSLALIGLALAGLAGSRQLRRKA